MSTRWWPTALSCRAPSIKVTVGTPNDDVNKSRGSNDTYPTAMHRDLQPSSKPPFPSRAFA